MPESVPREDRRLTCSKCGRVNNTDARFCDWCGGTSKTSLVRVTTPKPKDDTPPVDTPKPKDDTPPVDTPKPKDDTPPVDTPKPKDHKLPQIRRKSWIAKFLEGNLLTTLTLFGVCLGVVFGLVGRIFEFSEPTIMVIALPGELFMRLLRMLIIPLIVSGLVSGLTQLDPREMSRLGWRSMLYYVTTSAVAIVIGVVVCTVSRPGAEGAKLASIIKQEEKITLGLLDNILDFVRNLFPANLIQACFQQVATVFVKKQAGEMKVVEYNTTHYKTAPSWMNFNPAMAPDVDRTQWKRTLQPQEGMNVVGLTGFCLAMGILIGRKGDEVQILNEIFTSINDVVMKMVSKIIGSNKLKEAWHSPFAIMCLVAGKLLVIEDVRSVANVLGRYIMMMSLALVIHLTFITILFYFITRRNILSFAVGNAQSWVTAFATSSSAATLPITIRCMEENIKIDKRVSKFVLPVAVTLNMDGSALYQAFTAVFIAQMHNIQITPNRLSQICLTSFLASVTSAGVPSGGLVTTWVLGVIGLPANDVELIISVDWVMDRIVAVVDVITDAYCATVVAHLTKEELEQMDKRHRMRTGLSTVVRVMSDIIVPQLSEFYIEPEKEEEKEEEEEEEEEEEDEEEEEEEIADTVV